VAKLLFLSPEGNLLDPVPVAESKAQHIRVISLWLLATLLLEPQKVAFADLKRTVNILSGSFFSLVSQIITYPKVFLRWQKHWRWHPRLSSRTPKDAVNLLPHGRKMLEAFAIKEVLRVFFNHVFWAVDDFAFVVCKVVLPICEREILNVPLVGIYRGGGCGDPNVWDRVLGIRVPGWESCDGADDGDESRGGGTELHDGMG
jgi:hypothetical protein